MSKDIIFGIHSIEAALENKMRSDFVLYCTDKGLSEFKSKINRHDLLERVKLINLNPHQLQEQAKTLCQESDFQFQRVPSQIFLSCSELPLKDLSYIWGLNQKQTNLRFICLDQVTDTANAAAILRTSSFYNVDALLISQKGSFGLGPSFYRIASGATEHVPIIKISNLSSALNKIQEKGIACVGLSEHASDSNIIKDGPKKICLVLGSEENGISHAVKRILNQMIGLESQGVIKSLNVSVAAAVAMEKFFGGK